jgi:Glycosyl hydrolase catalytic core
LDVLKTTNRRTMSKFQVSLRGWFSGGRLAFFSVMLCWGCDAALADSSVTSAPIRVVDCEQKVQSHKRGVCANHLQEADFRAFAPGVSWYYNWHYETKDRPPDDVSMEYIPMAWGDRPDSVDGLDRYLSGASKKPRVVLAINEPNLKEQAFISPEKTAILYRKIKEVADKYQIAVVGPNMSLGSPEDGSIKAMDPIENKEVTYTFMVPFLKAFFFYMDKTEAPALGLHTYGSIGELKWAVDAMHKEFNRPVWVTEYAEWHAADAAAERDYLIQATDFLERTPYVQGYAWFKERADNAKISLLEKEPGKLSELGETYVNLPPHDDANLFYRIPGKLSAGKYLAIDQADILSNSHGDIMVTSNAAGATADYNIQVDTAGVYKLGLREMGSSTIEVLENNRVLGSALAGGSDVQTLEISAPLPAGPQTLRIRFGASGTIMSSINFVKP